MADTPKDKNQQNKPLYEYNYEMEAPKAASPAQPSQPSQIAQDINNLASTVGAIGTGIQDGANEFQDILVSQLGGNPADYQPNTLLNSGIGFGVAHYALTKGLMMAHGQYLSIQATRETNAGFFEPREIMARQLVMRGHASVDEILHSSYGEWPPKGLDIVGQNDQRVKITDIAGIENPDTKVSVWDRVKAMRESPASGLAKLDGERLIGINHLATTFKPGLLGTSTLGTVLGHEGVHSLQGDHYWRAGEVFEQYSSQEIWATQRNTASNTIAEEVFEQFTSTERKQSMHPKALAHLEKFGLTQGVEIQARMHQMVSNGYQRWGTMPQNHEQLMVALDGLGVKPPSNIMADLEKSPTIARTREIFSAGKRPELSSHDVNQAISILTDSGKQEFWHKAVPGLYSDLIEMYGDKQGRERFGLGQNPWPQRREWAAIEAEAKRDAAVKEHTPTAAKSEIHETAKIATGAKVAEAAGDVAHQAKRIHGGLVTNVVIGAAVGVVSYGMGSDLKESGKISLQAIIPYSEAVMKAAGGDTKGAVHSTLTETAGIVGAIAGASGGAMAGAALGSVVPIIGTAIGGVAGGIIGGIIGGVSAGMGTDAVLNRAPKITDTIARGVDATMTAVSGNGATVKGSQADNPKASMKPAFGEASKAKSLSADIITQQQKSILHKSGLDDLEMGAKRVDIETTLRNPASSKPFIATLDKMADKAQDPDVKHNIEAMANAARSYITLEESRKGPPATAAPISAPAMKASAPSAAPMQKI